MHTFKTNVNGSDVTWEIHLPFAAVKRLKATGLANLMEPEKPLSADEENSTIALLRVDLERFVDVVWELVKVQAERIGVDADQFAESLEPDAFLLCRSAFFGEWNDFFLKSGVPEKAAGLRKQLEVFEAMSGRIDQIQASEFMTPVEQVLKNLTAGSTSGS